MQTVTKVFDHNVFSFFSVDILSRYFHRNDAILCVIGQYVIQSKYANEKKPFMECLSLKLVEVNKTIFYDFIKNGE